MNRKVYPDSDEHICIQQAEVIDFCAREGGFVYRRRQCLKCNRRFSTNEIEEYELVRLRACEEALQQLSAAMKNALNMGGLNDSL